MKSLSSNAFLEYAKERKVILLENNKEEILENIREEDVVGQLYILGDFHKRVMGYDNYIGYRLEDKRGRMVEQYKVYLKKVKREYNVIKDKITHNSFEKLLLKYGEDYINRAQESIDIICNNSYLKLIKRSMDRVEVCLGNACHANLKREEYIEASNLNNCFYDLVEIDAVHFFNKLLKSGAKLNYKGLIEKFCEIEDLDEKSEKFIEALVAYPQDFMKCCSKYSRSYGNVDIEKYRSKLKKIIDNDNFSLLQGEV